MKVLIASLKFSPGHSSHLMAYQTMFSGIGHSAELLLDSGYRSFIEEDFLGNCVFVDGKDACSKCLGEADLVVIYNLSPWDASLIRAVRSRNSHAKAAIVYHEPYRGLAETLGSFFKGDRGLKHVVSILGRHAVSRSVLKQCDQVWLPSQNAVDEYERVDARINPSYRYFPLIFRDEMSEETKALERKYFSYISTALPAKGFAEYLACVKDFSKRDKSIQFQVVTKTDISKHLDEELNGLIAEGRLCVEQGRPQPNEVMNRAYAQSLCTWFGYNASTQSGVLCKAFMFGSPGIATRLGAFEECIDGTNSLFVDSNRDVDGVYDAFRQIAGNSEAFSARARDTYFELFDYHKHSALMAELLSSMGL